MVEIVELSYGFDFSDILSLIVFAYAFSDSKTWAIISCCCFIAFSARSAATRAFSAELLFTAHEQVGPSKEHALQA